MPLTEIADMPTLRSPLSYVGGKFRLLKHLLPLINPLPPGETEYVEPFGGGASVLIAKSPHPSEIYNDLNGDLFNFFKTLRDREPELSRRLKLTPYSRREFAAALQSKATDPVEQAADFYTKLNQAFGADISVGKGERNDRNWTVDKGSYRGMNRRVSAWLSKADRLHDVAFRLRTVAFENEDAIKLIKKRDSPSCKMFVDPPYKGQEYIYPVSFSQHAELAQALNAAMSKIVLTHYDCETVRELYPEGKWRYRMIEGKATVCGARDASRRELILWNFDAEEA